MKSCLCAILIPIVALIFTPRACADSTLDHYFNLRREHKAASLKVSQVKSEPELYRGRIIELRGSLSGTSRAGDRTCLILTCDDGCYVISADGQSEFPLGSRICVLAKIGERSTVSLSDLRLITFAYESEVLKREQKAIEAELRKQERLKALNRQAVEEQNKLKASKEAQKQLQELAVPADLVPAYKNAIKRFNNKLTDAEATIIAQSIIGFSVKYQVDPRLVVAVIIAESNFRPDATSHKGAMGLGQLMPGTAAGLGVSDPYNPVENIGGSVKLIRGHLDKLSGNAQWTELTWQDLSLALASYNAGPGAVKKYGGVPPYKETRNYINKVISIYKELCGCN